MIDSTPITTEIARLIAAGTHESELLSRVARKFPDVTSAEVSAALLEATAASRRHGDIDGQLAAGPLSGPDGSRSRSPL
jgi:hypothetical protein